MIILSFHFDIPIKHPCCRYIEIEIYIIYPYMIEGALFHLY